MQEEWVTEVRHNVREAKIILIGTKADRREIEDPGKSDLYNLQIEKRLNLREGVKVVSKEAGLELAKQIQAVAFYECSAAKMEGIEPIFMAAASRGEIVGEGKIDTEVKTGEENTGESKHHHYHQNHRRRRCAIM